MIEHLLNKVENNVAKGEITHHEHNFSFCHNVFKKLSATEVSETIY